ncbi:MAG: polysaccharide biosynthesis tyrosine autokinase [Micrococcaceae bacterium]
MAETEIKPAEQIIIREQIEPEKSEEKEIKFDLGKLLLPYKNHWKEVLLATILGLLLGVGVSLTQQKVYSAKSVGIVTAGKSDNLALASSGDILAKSRAATYVDLAKSRTVSEGVIKDLNLQNITPEALSSKITATNTTSTPNISIVAKANTPEEAMDIANSWIKVLGQEVSHIENDQTVNVGANLPSSSQGSSSNSTDGSDEQSIIKLVPSVTAGLPSAPIYPSKKAFGLAGMGVGLLIGIIYAWYQGQFDTRIRSRKDVEANFDTPILGMLPFEENMVLVDPMGDKRDSQRDNYRLVESFRELRTNLRYSNVDNPPRAIVVTSPSPGDGKSSLAANLAITIAATGTKVVIVDCDLRRPALVKRMGLVEGTAGLTEVLSGQAEVADVLQAYDKHGDILILPSGKVPPNPAELLQSNAMRRLVSDLKEEAILLLDTPPILPVNDAPVLSHLADGAIITISANKTKVEEIKDSLANMKKAESEVLGLIINRIPTTSADSRYYGYYYGGNDGYYYYYGQEDDDFEEETNPFKKASKRFNEHFEKPKNGSEKRSIFRRKNKKATAEKPEPKNAIEPSPIERAKEADKVKDERAQRLLNQQLSTAKSKKHQNQANSASNNKSRIGSTKAVEPDNTKK